MNTNCHEESPCKGDLTLAQPVSIWNRSIGFEPKKFFAALGKTVLKGACQDYRGAGESGFDLLDSLGLGKRQPSELAWLLISRALMAAIRGLAESHADLFVNRSLSDQTIEELSGQIEQEMAEINLAIDSNFFAKPDQLPLLAQLRQPLTAWLHKLGIGQPEADQMASRLPSSFVMALEEEWRRAPSDYAALKEHFSSPFTAASDEERGWRLYGMQLRSQVSERMFAEAFGVDKVYVPLRAYHDEKHDEKLQEEIASRARDIAQERRTRKVVFDLEEDFCQWTRNCSAPAVRFVSGGPGSGKSTFAKILAARLAKEGEIPVLYIPLHCFDATDNLIASVERYVEGNRYLSGSPLHAKKGKKRLLLVFDGLDELALQGKAAAEVADSFVDEVLRRIQEGNSQGLQRQAVVTGRTIVVQSVAAKLREAKQICHVLPYVLSEHDRKDDYHDPKGLLADDQRQTWWRQYGQAKGLGYSGMPKELNQPSLVEITSQPLLNYLVAIGCEHKHATYSDGTTLNQLYANLISAVHARQYEGGRINPCISPLKAFEFVRVLEEIAVAIWHGDGRTATAAAIRKQCERGGIEDYLDKFEKGVKEGARAGVARLLTAFYFRQCEWRRDGEPTFEFTHKSFGEYLTARRIIRLLDTIKTQRRRRNDDPEDGWDDKQALQQWTKLCAVVAMDDDILRFVGNEFGSMNQEQLVELQDIVRSMLRHAILHGLPFAEEFAGKGFKELLRLARNAEEALLAVHCGIAGITRQASKLDLKTVDFGEWISRLQGQRQGREPSLALRSLSWLDLSGSMLRCQNFQGACFEGAILAEANLVKADLAEAGLSQADLGKALLANANFSEAYLVGANLAGANLAGAKFTWADLANASFEGANLMWANLANANLANANLANANLAWANLAEVDFTEATIVNANITGTCLDQTVGSSSKLRDLASLPSKLLELK